jgi:CheY-like chemotaxis protein
MANELSKFRVLFLDDDDTRHETFVRNHSYDNVEIQQCWTADSAISCLKDKGFFDIVFLDHDLAEIHYTESGYEEPGTGMDVVDYMVSSLKSCKKPSVVIVHSWSSRAKEMSLRLQEAGFNTIIDRYESYKKYFKDPNGTTK